MDDGFVNDLLELRAQHAELLGMLDAVVDKPPEVQLSMLREVLAHQRRVGDSTKSARNKLERGWHARSERQRVDELKSADGRKLADTSPHAMDCSGWWRRRTRLPRA